MEDTCLNTWKQYNARDNDRNKGVENTKRLPFSYADSERKYQEIRLDWKVGIRMRTMNVMPRNLDGILKSDKEGILKILSLEMMRSKLYFRWIATTNLDLMVAGSVWRTEERNKGGKGGLPSS